MDTQEDRGPSLNDLPDVILKHILSFLSTKLAVRTSVLSKKWKYLWTFLTILDFRQQEEEEEEGRGGGGGGDATSDKRQLFMSFVDRTFILLNVPTIRKFSLQCSITNDASRISTWISGAVRRNAQEIRISFSGERDLNLVDENIQRVLPFCLFNSATMEVLELQLCFSVRLPSRIRLPRLKILTLKNIIFKDYYPKMLLFYSRALEQLVLDDCTWEMDEKIINIPMLKLLKLTINEGTKHLVGQESASNSVMIVAPRLKSFSYTGGFITHYGFPVPHIINEVTLKLHSAMKTKDKHSLQFEKLLRSIQYAKHMHLSFHFFEPLSQVKMPNFDDVIFLEVTDGVVDPSCGELVKILDKYPRLETLRFPMGFSLDSETYKFDGILNIKFRYLPSTLKKIMIGDFGGSIKEISVVQVLLAKMTSLETMEIVFRRDVKGRNEVIKYLLSALPRGSKSCKLCYA